MVDIQTVSIAIASASVIAGVVYYAFQVRHQTKIRETDLLVRLYALVTDRVHKRPHHRLWSQVSGLLNTTTMK